MSSIVANPAPASVRSQQRAFLMRGLKTFGFGIVIALGLSGAYGIPLKSALVHSVSIALACWFSIDTMRTLLARWLHRHAPAGSPESLSRWPGWPWMCVVVLIGTIVGFSAGNSLANLLTDRQSPGFMRGGAAQALSLLIGALIPGLAITYYFYSRETIAVNKAAVQTAQRQAAEHQLKLLESQLEPHMLFNTLANLRVLIALDPARAQAMLDQLIAFLRATLSASRAAQHPLDAEFARLADYLALMQVRMGGRLQTGFDLPDELAALPVPPLLLQPLVENAIKHGLEPKVGGGRIEISAARRGDRLELRVRDSGVGLSDGPGIGGNGIGTGNNGNGNGSGTGFGLVHVRERLSTLYAGRASLEIGPSGHADGGTLATIVLPLST